MRINFFLIMRNTPIKPSRFRLAEKKREDWERPKGGLAEFQAFQLLHRVLSNDWEIYHNPSLFQARPDFVLTSPHHGALIIEVKQWNLKDLKISSTAQKQIKYRSNGVTKRRENPFSQLKRYEDVLKQRCSDINGGSEVPINSLLILIDPTNSITEARKFTRHFQNTFKTTQVICHGDMMESTHIAKLEQALPTRLDKEIDGRTWNLLEYSLGKIDDFEIPGFRNWVFTPQQKELIYTRTTNGLRRIRGVAGSGKSIVIANRAVQLAMQGKEVLITCYNLTLVNLLHMMVLRAIINNNRQLKGMNNISIIHFHGWVKDMAYWTDNMDEYKKWLKSTNKNSKTLAEQSKCLKNWVEQSELHHNHYDAIFVDEGQDFCLEWWDALRSSLRPGGEMMLVADRNQDLYNRSSYWTEKAMTGSGFIGGWNTMQTAFRYPVEYSELLNNFGKTFLDSEEQMQPITRQSSLFDLSDGNRFNWMMMDELNYDDPNHILKICDAVREYLVVNDLSNEESILLTDTNKLGHEVVNSLNLNQGDILHTFDGSSKSKLAFTHHRYRLKATTFHSYKGWESPNLIVVVNRCRTLKQKKALYAALSRLSSSKVASSTSLLVVCADPIINQWYGSTFGY